MIYNTPHKTLKIEQDELH